MVGKLRRAIAARLAQERALKFGVSLWVLVVLGMILFNMLAYVWLHSPDDQMPTFALVLGLVIPPLVFAPVLALMAVRATWVTQRAMTDTVREERRARALRAGPPSPYGLPGYPEVGAGTGDLTEADSGGLTETRSEETTSNHK